MKRKYKRYRTPLEAAIVAMAITFLSYALFVSAPILAQVGKHKSETYQLRANIAMAGSIAPESAMRYGIDPGSRDALVNVVVLRAGAQDETVPASVEVYARNLTGQAQEVKMRATPEAGQVSYLGIYKFESDEVVDFDVVARPENSDEELRTRVRKHFPPG